MPQFNPIKIPIIVVAILVVFPSMVYSHGDTVVLITEDGFLPNAISIDIGTTVTWLNEDEIQRWPASDVHPTHTVYPGSGISKCATAEKGKILDACRGLKKGERYAFTFDKVGKWGIHDHLHPGVTMQVEVTESGHEVENKFDLLEILRKFFSSFTGFFVNLNPELPSKESFKSLSYFEQQTKMKEISSNDPERAWKFLKDAYTVDGQVKENPHELSHIVGNSLYNKLGVDGIAVCDPTFAFGCYHGVTEEMLLDLGKNAIPTIESRCLQLFPNQLALIASCIHGTGHGLLTWENLDVQKSLVDCDLLQPQGRIYCYDGVFMENSFSSPAPDVKDPWKLCSSVDEKYHHVCAKYHMYSFGKTVNWDFSEMAKSCEMAPSSVLRSSCFSGLGFFVANTAQGDLYKIRNGCGFAASEDGKYTCKMNAAIEVIFQGYYDWSSISSALCDDLSGEWKSECQKKTSETIKSYNKQFVDNNPPEIQQIKALTNMDEQSKIYRNLIERVGPDQAQEYLYRSGMPFTGQTHLLNHVVGDYLYEKYDKSGLVKCKEYFLASCYHGFIIRAIGDKGFEGMREIMIECNKYGLSVSSQCSHALGHGFLAWIGYKNLPQAAELCDKMTEKLSNFAVFNCRDGVFMENIWGVHAGEPAADRWINEDDLFYPCNDTRINPNDLDGCWSNQPSLMYQMLKGDIKKVGEQCLKVTNSTHQKICFNALARQIHPIAKGDTDSTFKLCNLLPTEWINYCMTTVAVSDFSVGGRDLSFKICSNISEESKGDCYNSVFGSMSVYARSQEEFNSFCIHVLEENWKSYCIKRAAA